MLGESVEYKTHPLLSVSFSFTVREAGEVGGCICSAAASS